MLAKLAPALFLLLPAFGQLDSYTLRAKFGSPLNREVFHMPQGFDMVVDYGAGSQVCRVQVPATMPSHEAVSNDLVQKRRMYEFLAEVIPSAIRGSQMQQGFHAQMGVVSLSSDEYEHVRVVEMQAFGQHSDTITITFKRDECEKAQ